MSPNFTHVDLFCGPGGFAAGFEAAGFETLLGLDVHEPSLKTYRHNHPSAAAILGDIRQIGNAQIAANLPGGRKTNVLTAGVPCEGFSMANRNRLKFTDERNFLFVEFLRVAEYLKPDVVVVENVANLTRQDGGFFAQEIEGGMASLGYRTTSLILNAADFGVPQRRRRVIFIGMRDGLEYHWPKPTHGIGLGMKPYVTVGQALLGDLPELKAGEFSKTYKGPATNEYQKLMRQRRRVLLNHQAPKHPQATVDRIANTEPGMPMYPNFKQRIRLHPDQTSPTIVSGGIRPQFAYGHPTQARGMTIRERARLMSFPDSYEFLGGVTQGRVQTGDAVPPLLAYTLAVAIRSSLLGDVAGDLNDLGIVHVKQVLAGHGAAAQLELS
jgi:DNA (cytosine-5)-methyltransferase 1